MVATLGARLLFFTALVAVAACPAAAAELRIGLASEVTSVDPHHQNISANNEIGWHVFDALVHVDENARLIPGLALSWQAVDPTTWEFRLRRGVRFHDGSEFTAEDVIFSLERAAHLPNGQFASFVQRIIAKEAVDPHTLRLGTATPYAMVPSDLNSVFIVSHRAAAGAATADFNSGRATVGTGPYKFVRFARGDRVELARNEAYWDKSVARWDRVIFRIMPSDPARLAALLAGDVDLIEQIPTPDIARLRGDDRLRIVQKVSWRTIFLYLEQARDHPSSLADKSGRPLPRNPLKDARVRLALSRAINRQAIAERIMDGAALPAAELVAPQIFGHDPELKPERFDPQDAKRLLAQAGFPDGFAMTLAAPNNRYVNDSRIAQAIAQMLAHVGLAMNVETMPINVYLTKTRAGAFACGLFGWGSYSGDLALRALVATPDAKKGYGAFNRSNYSNPRVDALLDRAFATLEERQREALAREAMDVAMKDIAVIPLHHQVAIWALRRPLAYRGRTDEFTLAHHVRIQQ